MDRAGLVLINSLLETIPGMLLSFLNIPISVEPVWLYSCSTFVCRYSLSVRSEVDSYIGIDYSLLQDPVVTESSLDMDFRVTVFFMFCISYVTDIKQ